MGAVAAFVSSRKGITMTTCFWFSAAAPFSLAGSAPAPGPVRLSSDVFAAPSRTAQEVSAFRLAAADEQPDAATKSKQPTLDSKQTASSASSEGWDIWGPIELRSADPEPLGEVEVKNIFNYGTSSDGTDDDSEYEFEVEYGIAPGHELIFEIPVQLFDGAIDGNADITLGWHWQLWKEQDLLPAFAMRNYIRVPSGYHSDGVDYELKGLITKSIIPDKWRLHLNPFLKSVNGNMDEDGRYFQCGFIVGTDYRLADNLTLNLDYIHETGESEGERNQHTMEVGLDWKFAPNQGIGFVTRNTLDGDGIGQNWGFGISYVYTFEDVPAIGK